jgi:N-acetylmuramic acid 6-phosphate etherase
MVSSGDHQTKAEAFLAIAAQFRLGALHTEQPHPLTTNLSALARENPAEALRVLHTVDRKALAVLQGARVVERIVALAAAINATFEAGGSVFLCGCGATGRLSLACETLWRRVRRGKPQQNRVVSFMAGGDAALVRSIENFEDHPEYGARQLEELRFGNGDLLISCTEGGETPFVIGATQAAADLSSRKPFFLYCNPDEVLCKVAERSCRLLADSRIEKINLSVGPMAVTGSTRMQASTVLMAAVGLALLNHDRPDAIRTQIDALAFFWQNIDPLFLERFIVKESAVYQAGEYCLYQTDADLAITILTDTTERSPTFSMLPFENVRDQNAAPALCYLHLLQAPDSETAWERILGRPPRTLQWQQIGEIASYERLKGFDFSVAGRERRLATAGRPHHFFTIRNDAGQVVFDFEGDLHALCTDTLDLLGQHLVLKMLLNMHSTLVMGRLGRFEGNVMTWVKPSNNKLIDRTIRYADHLLKSQGVDVPYERLAYACFELREKVAPDQPLVYALVKHFSAGPS